VKKEVAPTEFAGILAAANKRVGEIIVSLNLEKTILNGEVARLIERSTMRGRCATNIVIVRHFQRGKNWRRVYFEWSDYSEKTWKGFAKVWDKAGGGPISPKSSRLVNDVVAKKLLAYW